MMQAQSKRASIDEALRNWARWVRVRPAQGRCASIEHRYRLRFRPDNAPTGWGDWSPSVPAQRPPEPIDSIAALAVERCMRAIPEQHRDAIILAYVYQCSAGYAARLLNIRYEDLDRFLDDACAMLKNILQFNKKVCMLSANSSHQRYAEILEPFGSR